MALLSEICAFLQNIEAATTIYALLSPWANHNIVLGSGAVCMGSASHFLGLVSRTMGDFSVSIKHFDEAINMNEKMGAAPAAIRSRFELAQTLECMGEEPKELLQCSYEEAQKIGMDGIAHRSSKMFKLNI